MKRLDHRGELQSGTNAKALSRVSKEFGALLMWVFHLIPSHGLCHRMPKTVVFHQVGKVQAAHQAQNGVF